LADSRNFPFSTTTAAFQILVERKARGQIAGSNKSQIFKYLKPRKITSNLSFKHNVRRYMDYSKYSTQLFHIIEILRRLTCGFMKNLRQ
jgi:hypothetical protein